MSKAAMSVLILLVAVSAVAQESPRERLQMLEGEWTLEGREDTFRETCSWFHKRSHMVCNSESRKADGTFGRGVTVMSWSEEKQRFLYFHYGSSGRTVAHDLFLRDGVLYGTGERPEGTDLVRFQVRMAPRADGSFDFVEEESKNAGPWTKSAEVHYVRVKPAAK
jgi:hypothetical protein